MCEPDFLGAWAGLHRLAASRNSKSSFPSREHVVELMAILGCRAFDTDAYRELLALAVSLAQGTPRAERLVQSVIDEARSRHILLPTRRAIDLLCHRARARSESLLQGRNGKKGRSPAENG